MLVIRRVVGESMTPALRPGQIVIGYRRSKILRPGCVVIIRHGGREKIKRLTQLKNNLLFVSGDNARESTDSRHFGWVAESSVLAKVIWPRV